MRPKQRLGQHFLEPIWIEKVIEAIQPRPTDVVLEIGAGRGALTIPLARRVARLVAIEVDGVLAGALRRHAPSNVEVVAGDILRVEIATLLARSPDGTGRVNPGGEPQSPVPYESPDRPADPPVGARVVGNLPYYISTPVLFRLCSLAEATRPFVDATLMLQREVAERLVAAPGSRNYGILTIFIGLAAEVTTLLALPPGAFRPAPRVSSSLVRLVFRPNPVEITDRRVFEQLVRSLFTRRRKTLLNAVRPFAASLGRQAELALAEAALDPGRRPETLHLAELARLARVFADGPQTGVI